MRVDVPTLRCDRCNNTTQDVKEMGSFCTLTHYHMSETDEWDLCPRCWSLFLDFLTAPELALDDKRL